MMLIADSGSTKTDWVLQTETGAIERFQSVGINPFYQSEEDIFGVLSREVRPNISSGVRDVFFYGAGCADEKSSKPAFDALKRMFPEAGVVQVASDMLGAARGLCGHEPGLACILGTGANNAFFDGSHIVRSIGSLGFWLGDEGSGSFLGKTLIVHFLQNELPEDLHLIFTARFPEINRLFVLDIAYKKPFPNRFFASFSSFLSEYAAHPFITEMILNAFRQFVTKYVLKHEHIDKFPVHFTGSIAFYYQDILKKALSEKGLRSGYIEKSPLEGLLRYHGVSAQSL